MSNKTTLRSLCISRITPIAAALAFTLTATSSYGAATDGRTVVEQKLSLVKPGLTIVKATATDLIAAVGLALADVQDGTPTTPAASVSDVASGVLLADGGGKVRGDRDTVAPQIIATTALFGNLNATDFAAVVKNIYSVNGASTKTALTAKGKANVIVAAATAAGSTGDAATFGTAVGSSIGADPEFLNVYVAASAALAKAKTTLVVGEKLESFLGTAFVSKGLTATSAQALVQAAADKVAASNPEAAGVLYGGLVKGFAASYGTKAQVESLVGTVTGDKKLAKATGAILANALVPLSAQEKVDIAATLTPLSSTKSIAADSLVVQGVLRSDVAGALTAQNISDIIGQVGGVTAASKATAKATLAGVLAVGNDGAKLKTIIDKVADGVTVTKDLAAIGAAAINSVGVGDPEAAGFVAQSLLENLSAGQAAELGAAIVPKVKAYAAAGFMAKQLVVSGGVANAPAIAAAIMAKNTKAGVDVAARVSEAVGSAGAVAFATAVANNNKALVQNVAVGTSVANVELAGDITAAVITHNPGVDKAAVSKAATISGAVALAADAEAASLIAAAVGAKMAATPTGVKPIKVSAITALATSLVKSLQTKGGVDTKNRMDEVGEVAAALAQAVIGSGADTKTGDKLLSAVGTAIVKGLSKTFAPKSAFTFYKAGLIEAGDVAGSMLLTLQLAIGTSDATRFNALIGTSALPGTLASALLKASGKAGTPANAAVAAALEAVRNSATVPTGVAGFETGAFFDPETDSRDAN